MPRRYQVLAASLGLGAVAIAVAVAAQRMESSSSNAAPPTAAPVATPWATEPIAEPSVPDTTVPASTVAATTTVAVTTTTTTTTPATTTTVPAIDPNCPTTEHAAVIDRDRQRAWLCDRGVALPEFVVTTARTLPDPGTFPVYDKDMRASSRFGGHYSTMTHFVAFTRGENTGARVAFHTIPVLTNGEYAQTLESVGTEERHGDSAGCIRVLPDQGQVVWDWLDVGDEVRVIN